MEALCRNLLWSAKADGRKAYVAWEIVCEPKNVVGLKIKNLIIWNKAILLKLLWNIQTKAGKLWIGWLETYFMKGISVLQW